MFVCRVFCVYFLIVVLSVDLVDRGKMWLIDELIDWECAVVSGPAEQHDPPGRHQVTASGLAVV